MAKCNFLFAGLLVCSLNSYSQSVEPIETDRPDQTESPIILPAKHFQMENGFYAEGVAENTKNFGLPSTLFRYAFDQRIELRMIATLMTVSDSDYVSTGLGPVSAGFKLKIADEKNARPAIGLLAYLIVPYLATSNFKTKWVAPSFIASAQKTLSQRFDMGCNLGMEWDGNNPDPIFLYTLTTDYSVSEKIDAYVEIYGFIPQGSKASLLFDTGFSYRLKQNISLDLSGGAGINVTEYFIAAGFSFRLKD